MGVKIDFVYLITTMPWTCIGGDASSQSQENCRAIVFVLYVLAGGNFLEHAELGPVLKGGAAAPHLVDEDADGPPVHRVVVALVDDDLRRQVPAARVAPRGNGAA